MKNPKFIIIGTVFIVTGLLLAVYFLAQKDLLSFLVLAWCAPILLKMKKRMAQVFGNLKIT